MILMILMCNDNIINEIMKLLIILIIININVII